MQALTFQNDSEISHGAMINRAQAHEGPSHEDIRDAVRAWAGVDGQDVVTALIIEEYRAQGGDDITFPDDLCRKRQKLFRFLDNQFNSERYRENVRQLTPAILAVLPLEFRGRLAPQDDFMSRYAAMEKEVSEAKRALMLNAPQHQMVKEVREGIEHLLGLLPVEAMAQVLSGIAVVAPGIM